MAATLSGLAQDQAPEPAQKVIASAAAKAREEKKAVFVHFSASWCTWCKRLETVLDHQDFNGLLNDSFVLVKLVTRENGERKNLENPGADKLLAEWGGGKGGLPFIMVLNDKGEKIADSNRMPKGGNIGCPTTSEEVEAFNKILEETAPRISADQRTRLGAFFLELNKKK